MDILVSIIVPVYNVEKYLFKCIESILTQNLKEFELILIDDGSTDESGKICEIYANKDQRIKVIHQENKGLSAARNKGIDIAKGEYIGFVDSDDWIEPEMYEVLYTTAQTYNAEIVQCKFKKTLEGTDVLQQEVKILNPLEAINYGYDYPKLKINMTVAWNKIYKRTLFHKTRYPIGKINEDEFITYKLLYNANKTILIDKQLYFYRQRESSIMGQAFNIQRYDAIDAIGEKLEFAKCLDENLYLKVLREYAHILLEMFINTEVAIADNSMYLRQIKMKYKIIFMKVIHNPYISYQEKIKYILFRWMPRICSKVLRKKRKVWIKED